MQNDRGGFKRAHIPHIRRIFHTLCGHTPFFVVVGFSLHIKSIGCSQVNHPFIVKMDGLSHIRKFSKSFNFIIYMKQLIITYHTAFYQSTDNGCDVILQINVSFLIQSQIARKEAQRKLNFQIKQTVFPTDYKVYLTKRNNFHLH